MDRFNTRMGDGSAVQLSAEEIRQELQSGTLDAADRGKIPELDAVEIDYLFELVTSPVNVTSVIRGKETVTSSDSGAFKINYQANISMDRATAIQVHEKVLAADSLDLALLPIGDNFTMGIDDAVVAASFLKAKTVIPYHYNTWPLIETDPQEFKSKVEEKRVAGA